MIENLLNTMKDLMTHSLWLAPLIALIAGIIASFTPCCLSSIPLIIGYVGGYAGNDSKKAFKYSLTFCIGTAISYTGLGIILALIGGLMREAGSWWYILLGILMVVMALQMWEVINIIPTWGSSNKNPRKGYVGAFLAGLVGGVFSSPCSTPVLVVLLAMVASGASVIMGLILLLLYSLGHSILPLIAGTSMGFVKQISASNKYANLSKVIKIVTGSVILLLAFYMFYEGF